MESRRTRALIIFNSLYEFVFRFMDVQHCGIKTPYVKKFLLSVIKSQENKSGKHHNSKDYKIVIKRLHYYQ